jgi:transposase
MPFAYHPDLEASLAALTASGITPPIIPRGDWKKLRVTTEAMMSMAVSIMPLPPGISTTDYSVISVDGAPIRLRWLVRTGATWRMMPHDLPPWSIVYQQTQRWLAAGCFEARVEDLRLLLRGVKGRKRQPSAALFDSRVLQSTPESGGHAGYDGAKRRKGSKVHVTVDTLGHLLTLLVTPANEQDRAQVAELAQRVQEAMSNRVAALRSF